MASTEICYVRHPTIRHRHRASTGIGLELANAAPAAALIF